MPYITQAQATKLNYPKKLLQTILFNKHKYSLKEAREWLKEHGYLNKNYRRTTNEIRFIQNDVIKGAKYYSKKITPDIIFIFEEY